ncbi:flagellin lysine-N-methylase [Desulfosarcina ovata]|uniref:flagellin lysine-N-methylase n=1 Tax=Desulfosarcina ovata TaxID=83564 RepID=UPI0012D2E807|nr:flagellin lysine-N-methylase [Desulfosarcina ovata]
MRRPLLLWWDIIVDKRSYQRYRKSTSTPLGQRLRAAVRRNHQDPSITRYARIVRSGDAACPFLTQDRRCRIHAELGEEWLPDTCAVFPRHLRARQGWIDISASLACPEIARRALANPSKITIAEAHLDTVTVATMRAVEPTLSYDGETAGLTLRTFALSLLQNRRLALWRRLLALGYLFEMVSLSEDETGADVMPAILDAFTRRMESGEVMGRIEEAPTLTGMQLQLIRRLHDEMISSVCVTAFRHCTEQCLDGLDYAGAQPFTETIGRRYDFAFDHFYRPFFRRYGFMLENYLVSYLLHHDICFHRGGQLYEDYIMMVLNFAMLKTYLIGMAAWHRENFHPDMVTRLIYSFTKVVEPDARFRDYALGLLAQSGCTDMMHLAVLIRN